MTTIYWTRHAEAEGNLYRRCHGQYDSLVTENGKAQILALRKRFNDINIDAVVSSDLYRTRKTAEAVSKPRNLEIKTHRGLREIHLGLWEDLTWCDLGRRWPELDEIFSHRPWDFDITGGESMTTIAERGLNALKEIASTYKNKTVAVFSHGMITRAVMTLVSGLRLNQMNALPHGDNTSVTLIEAGDDGTLSLKYYADNSHLGDLSTLARQTWWREGSKNMHDDGFWYREPNFETEAHIVEAYRRDAWQTIYGTLENYNPEMFVEGAKLQSELYPMAVVFAMNGDEIAGLLQLDAETELKPGAGHISFFYLEPRFRGKGLGVQMLGQAVSFYRKLNRTHVALRVSDKNTNALRFYKRYGFTQFGKEKGFSGKLLFLELDIRQT
jgi:probable phosphoglycerate mutase